MRSSILRRLLLVVVTIVAGGLVSATLVRCAPGFGADERQLDTRLSSGTIQAIQNAHADERNIVGFFFASVCKTLRGDFGVSRSLNRPVRQLLQERAGVTAALAGKGLALSWSAAVVMVLATWFVRTRALGISVTLLSGALLCLPAGVLALLAILLNQPDYLVIALIVYPKVHRYLSNLVEAARGMPHILTARAKGASESRMFLWHVVPVIRREVLALAGVSIGIAISAAIPVEALCGIPGIGQLTWQAALGRDLPLLNNVAMLVIGCVVLANSGADLLGEEPRRPA
ncbi:MAG TPA: ABC transporter permease [Terriglobales bacterium]|nr:ABC transporter permease [Terriglobales bacterium]